MGAYQLDDYMDVLDHGTIREKIDSGAYRVLARKPAGYRRDSRSGRVYPKYRYSLKKSENSFIGWIVSYEVFKYGKKKGLAIIEESRR